MKHRGVNSALAFFLTGAQPSGGDLSCGSGMSELTCHPPAAITDISNGPRSLSPYSAWSGASGGTEEWPRSLGRQVVPYLFSQAVQKSDV
jgi:hypothetical protein